MDEESKKIFRAFVLMPFDSKFDSIYTDLIKPALEKEGYEVNRADSISSQQNILKDVVRGIASADLIVADLTDQNSNVFYELGIAHTMQKPTVLLTQSIEEIPFDLRSYRVIPYSIHFKEAPSLQKSLREIGEKAKSGSIGFGNPVSDFLPQVLGAKALPIIKPESGEIKDSGEKVGVIEEEEKGLWDFVVTAEKSTKDVVTITGRITKATLEVGEKIKQRTREGKEILDGRQPIKASRVHKIAAAVARDLTGYAQKLEDEQPKFQHAWESIDANITGWLQTTRIRTAEDKKATIHFRSIIDETRTQTKGAIEGIEKFREAVKNSLGISQDVNRASKRLVQVLSLLITNLEGAYSYLTKVLVLLDEKIEKEGDV